MLNKKTKYLQIALNSTLYDAESIISQLPLDKKIILEAGTPLIKTYGGRGIEAIKSFWENRVLKETFPGFSSASNKIYIKNMLDEKIKSTFPPYIVADMKCQDRGKTEVKIAMDSGANAITVNGYAPIETINSLIKDCQTAGLDSMIDMMNVEQPIKILRLLKKLPTVVILHRGVDEEIFNPDTPVPFNQINKIRASFDVLIAIAGGDTIRDVQRAIFNDANIVVVWKDFYERSGSTAQLAQEFLKKIR